MDNGPDREVSKVEDLSKFAPSKIFKLIKDIYGFSQWMGSKGKNFYQSRKEKNEDKVKRAFVEDLLKKDENGKIHQLLSSKTEWQKYLNPEPKSRLSKLFDFIFNRKSAQQMITHPKAITKSDSKIRNSFLNELKTKDKQGILTDLIKNNPELIEVSDKRKNAKITPVKAADTNLNVTAKQSGNKEGKKLGRLSERVSNATQKAARANAKLQENERLTPPTRRHSMPNVSLGGH